MSEINDFVNKLEKKLQEVNVSRMDNRRKEIDKKLKQGELLSKLSEDETLYVHTKLHMMFTYKYPEVSKPKIQELHTKVVKMMDNHINTDKLDTLDIDNQKI